MNGAPHASANTILEQLWRRLQLGIEDTIAQHVENQLGGLVKGGLLNAGMLYGSIPSRETVKNATGGALVKGQAVYASGDSSGVTTVAKARANADATMPALGLLGEDIANGAQGVMIKVGRLQDFDTSAWTVGTQLYVSSATAGALTSTAPSSRAQLVAVVIIQDATTGAVEVIAGATSKLIDHTHSAAGDGGGALMPDVLGTTTQIVEASLSSGTVNNWDPGGAIATTGLVVRVSTATGDLTFRGIVAPTGNVNRVLYVINDSGSNFTFNHDDSGATAGNRIQTPIAESIQVPYHGAIIFYYETHGVGFNTWRVISPTRPITHAHSSINDGSARLDPSSIEFGGVASFTSLGGTTQNNLAIGDVNLVKLNGASDFTLTGMVPPTSGGNALVILQTTGAGGCTIPHLSGSSSTGEQFVCPNGQSFYIAPGGAVIAIYGTHSGGFPEWWLIDPIPNPHNHSANAVGGQLTDSAIATGAEIDVAKLADGAANDVLVTNADGVTVNWAQLVNANVAVTYAAFTVSALTQSGAVTFTTGVARYCQIGKLVHAYFKITATAAGTTANAIVVTLPAALTASANAVTGKFAGVGDVFRTGVAAYPCNIELASSTTIKWRQSNVTSGNYSGADTSFALANGDVLCASMVYELA